jgi:outer membrane protein assembly factor BamB
LAVSALAAGLVGVLAACSGSATAPEPETPAPATSPAPPTTTAEEAEQPEKPAPPPARVRVVDGDTGKRIRGAVVVVGKERARSNEFGTAALHLGRHQRRGLFRVRAAGYSPEEVRARVRRRGAPLHVELYRPTHQWRFYGGNLARTQAHPAIGLRPPFRVTWSRGLRWIVEFPTVVWKGVGYVSSLRGFVTAIDLDNGRVIWRTQVGTRMAASPGLAPERNELAVTTMLPGQFVVLDMRTGRKKWTYSSGPAEPSPVIRGGIAYAGGANGNVFAVDLERRRVRWVYRGGSKITSSPALVGRRLYFGDYGGRVVCLDAKTGRTIWVGSGGTRVYGTVAVGGGRVFAPSVFSGLSALSARTGRLLWRNSPGTFVYSSPAFYRGRVYYGTYGGQVYSADAKTGRVIWGRSAGGIVSGAVQVVAGVVYAASFGSQTNGWAWRSGRRVFHFGEGKYVPISGNAGKLLLHGSRRVYALVPKGDKRRSKG